jgi:hypothetical protein
MTDRTPRVPARTKAARIWGEEGYRVFLSHKAEVKEETAALKEGLRIFGASCFVAHQDIAPTKAWQDEIENALLTMDAFVALLTEDFHESDWTDQEVGFALARGVPIIGVNLGKDPYGFIGKFQALSCEWTDAPTEIAKLLIKESRMLEAYIAGLSGCMGFDDGNKLAQILPEIDSLTAKQVEALVSTYTSDPQLRGSWGFNGAGRSQYGKGLAFHLTRITGERYSTDKSGQIAKLQSPKKAQRGANQ